MDAKTYFYNEVMMAVEVHHGFWETVKGADLEEFLKPYDTISDLDFACHQPNTFCSRVIKLADLNFFENRSWREKHNLRSLSEVTDYILENGLWRP